jgi:colicin import membrane protein
VEARAPGLLPAVREVVEAATAGSPEDALRWTSTSKAKVAAAVRANTIYGQEIQGNPRADFEVRLQPNGKIIGVQLVRSSGVPTWDSASERAIRRTDPFPCPPNAACPASLLVTHGPKD